MPRYVTRKTITPQTVVVRPYVRYSRTNDVSWRYVGMPDMLQHARQLQYHVYEGRQVRENITQNSKARGIGNWTKYAFSHTDQTLCSWLLLLLVVVVVTVMVYGIDDDVLHSETCR